MRPLSAQLTARPLLAMAGVVATVVVFGATSISAQVPAQVDSGVVAQPATALDPAEGGESDPETSFLSFPEEIPEGAWLEVTPLGLQGRAFFAHLDQSSRLDAVEGGVDIDFPGDLPTGPAMVCTGAADLAVGCRRVFLYRSLTARGEPGENLDIEVSFAGGLEIRGQYLMDGRPLEGARVSLVPATLEAGRAFAWPLKELRVAERTVEEPTESTTTETTTTETTATERTATETTTETRGRLLREVVTDEDGRFLLPAVQGGRYRLETLLPTGRVHRPEPFDLPAAEDAAGEVGPLSDDQSLIWDLGELEVDDWLAVEVSVIDDLGEPIEGAEVIARQGQSMRTLVSFRASTDERGYARLSGFDPEQPLRLDCFAGGHGPWGADFELLPVEQVCRLDRLARLEGQLLGVDGSPLADGAVSALAVDVDDGGAEASGPDLGIVGQSNAEGGFAVELPPGDYLVTAAAPGFLVDRRRLLVAGGESVDLGPIILAPGRAIEGRVIEAQPAPDGPPPLVVTEPEDVPIPFAEIRALEPPAAATAVADGAGEFAISSIGEVNLHLEVRAEGFAAERIELEPAAQRRDEPMVIELHRGGWIRALVGTGEEPCAGCTLRLEPGGVEMSTDGDGEALTPALRPGRYHLEKPQVLYAGSQVIEIPAALRRHARVVAGEITTVRFELEPERMAVHFEPEIDDAWWLIVRTSEGEEKLERDVDGFFHAPRPNGRARDLFLTRFDPASGHDLEVRVATLEGSFRPPDNEAVLLPLPSGQIRGRVRGQVPGQAAVRDLAGVRVRLQTVASGAHVAELFSDSEGRFHLPHIPPGVYSVVLGERSFQFISLAEGTSLDLGEFQLVEGGY